MRKLMLKGFLPILLIFFTEHISAAARFWVAAGSSNWNNTANWSATSGGAGGASVPVIGDDVNFDNGGLGSCTIDIPVSVKTITVTLYTLARSAREPILFRQLVQRVFPEEYLQAATQTSP